MHPTITDNTIDQIPPIDSCKRPITKYIIIDEMMGNINSKKLTFTIFPSLIRAHIQTIELCTILEIGKAKMFMLGRGAKMIVIKILNKPPIALKARQ